MPTIAIYSLKGGVGKTAISVNLACASAQCKRRTLLWDLDPQGASSWILGQDGQGADSAESVFARDIPPERLIRPTAIPDLDLLPADASLRRLDGLFGALGKRKRLLKLLDTLTSRYDRILLDCPPGLTETSEQVARAATLIVAPVIPSPLACRALHLSTVAAQPDWPVVPMASAVEQMGVHRAPVTAFAPTTPAAQAFSNIWTIIERRLAETT